MAPHPDYKPPPFTWTGPGCPIHKHGPTPDRIQRIYYRTQKDRQDRIYWSVDGGTWRRLDGPDFVNQYKQLNRVLG